MKDKTSEMGEPSTATAVVNYILNKSMPFLCGGGFLFYEFGWMSLAPYFVLGLMWFASYFSFSCGYSAAVVENNFGHMIMRLAEEDVDEEDIIKTKEKKTK
jgi:hypothetical protein